MIQLTYEAAYDPYNAAFRVLQILSFKSQLEMPVERVHILDFYLAFPYLIQKIRATRAIKAFIKANKLDQLPKPYSDLPRPVVIFQKMRPIQEAAMQTLCLQGILDIDAYAQGTLRRSDFDLPSAFAFFLKEKNEEKHTILSLLVDVVGEVNLIGKDGLKDRSGLMEYKYDTL